MEKFMNNPLNDEKDRKHNSPDDLARPGNLEGQQSDSNVREIANKIFEALPNDGEKLGNTSLMRTLGLSPLNYWEAVRLLDEDGLVIRGTGRGGSLGRASIKLEDESNTSNCAKGALVGVDDETELYEPLKDWFDSTWGPGYQTPGLYLSKITGPPKGHKRKSGKYSRPDVTVLAVSSFEYVYPKKKMDVCTVEAKRADSINNMALLEAISHTKFSNLTYTAFEWLDDSRNMDDCSDEDVLRVLKDARVYGIGVLQMRRKGSDWEVLEIVPPDERPLQPQECNDYIEIVFANHLRQIRNTLL
jgi:hypothetical protein